MASITDQNGLTLTVAGGGTAVWTFTRSDGAQFSQPASLSQSDAEANALSTSAAMPPTSDTAAPTPVPALGDFATAVEASSAAAATKLLVLNWIPSLQLAIQADNTTLITSTWTALVSANSISTADASTIAALANTCNIPGIG